MAGFLENSEIGRFFLTGRRFESQGSAGPYGDWRGGCPTPQASSREVIRMGYQPEDCGGVGDVGLRQPEDAAVRRGEAASVRHPTSVSVPRCWKPQLSRLSGALNYEMAVSEFIWVEIRPRRASIGRASRNERFFEADGKSAAELLFRTSTSIATRRSPVAPNSLLPCSSHLQAGQRVPTVARHRQKLLPQRLLATLRRRFRRGWQGFAECSLRIQPEPSLWLMSLPPARVLCPWSSEPTERSPTARAGSAVVPPTDDNSASPVAELGTHKGLGTAKVTAVSAAATVATSAFRTAGAAIGADDACEANARPPPAPTVRFPPSGRASALLIRSVPAETNVPPV